MKLGRLQILVAMIALAGIAAYALSLGIVEVATGCTGGMIALGMAILKGDS